MVGHRHRGGGRLAALLVAGLSLAWADAAPAEEPAPPPVSRDALFKLPPTTPSPRAPREVGGATRTEWQESFARARGDVAAAEQRLASAQEELEEMASSSEAWQVTAPGAAAGASENGPLSFALREEIRAARAELDTARKALDELRIEANLAGVPQDWIAPPESVPVEDVSAR